MSRTRLTLDRNLPHAARTQQSRRMRLALDKLAARGSHSTKFARERKFL